MDVDVVIATIGITIIINFSRVLSKFRGLLSNVGFNKFIICPMCVGFWVGGILKFYKCEFIFYDVLLYASIGSISSYSWFLLMKNLMNKHG